MPAVQGIRFSRGSSAMGLRPEINDRGMLDYEVRRGGMISPFVKTEIAEINC
jgi:hypothetical protein